MKNIYILWGELLLLLILLGNYFIFLPNINKLGYDSIIIVIAMLSILLFSCRSKPQALKNNYLTITFLCLLGFCIVHFQFYIDFILGLTDDLSLGYYLDYNIIPKSITLAAIALNVFCIGSIIGSIQSRNSSQFADVISSYKSKFSFRFLGFFVVCFLFLFIYVTPAEFFRGGYGDFSNSVGISYLQAKSHQLFLVFTWAYIICKSIIIAENNKPISFINYLFQLRPYFLLCILTYFLLVASAGDRGGIIYTSIMLLAGYYIPNRKKLTIGRLIILLIIAASLTEFLAFFRSTGSDLSLVERLQETRAYQAEVASRGNLSISPSTRELALSLRAYHAVIMDQETHNMLYGLGNLGDIISIVPGLGLLIQSITSLDLSSSTHYITEVLNSDHGMGTTTLADVYLNFGVIGVLVIFPVFGYIFSSLDYKAQTSYNSLSLFPKTFFLVYLIFGIYIGRSSFSGVFSNLILVFLVILLAKLFARSRLY